MKEKRIIEVDEYKQQLILGALNEKRNDLIQHGSDTEFVDEILLEVMDAPTRKQRKKTKETGR